MSDQSGQQHSSSDIQQASKQTASTKSGGFDGAGALVTIGGVVIAVLIGLGRGAARNGGDLARGLGRGLDNVHAPRGIDGHPNLRVKPSLDSFLPKRPDAQPAFTPRQAAVSSPDGSAAKSLAAEAPSTVQRGIEVKDVDFPGLLKDFMELSADQLKDNGPAMTLLTQGLELKVICPRSLTEYAGKTNDELSVVREMTEMELEVSMAGQVLQRTRETGVLPDTEAGEFDRCRVRFGGDGRPFISFHLSSVYEGETEPVEFRGHYELQLVEGTQADYEGGKPVRLVYSDEGLKRLKADWEKQLTDELTRTYQSGLGNAPAVLASGRIPKVTFAIQEFPNSRIVATHSACVIEDRQPMVAKATIAFTVKPSAQ